MTNHKILVIEDNFEVRENICEILSLAGYEVSYAENGKKGIELAVSIQPDLILCDVMMPELDGFGVLKILNKNIHTQQIPFIFLTAKTEPTDLRKGMGLGADDYITKPFDDTDLLEAIEIRLTKDQFRKKHPNSQTQTSFDAPEKYITKRLLELVSGKELRSYTANTIIYKKNMRPRWAYFIQSGSIKTIIENDFGKQLMTAVYSENSLFGQHSIFRQTPYYDSAITLSDTSIYMIPADQFLQFIYDDHLLTQSFLQFSCDELQNSETKSLEHAYSSVRRKTAKGLIQLSNLLDEDKTLKMSREDFATYCGMAKETLIRTLTDLKNENLIKTSGSEITILNHQGLEDIT